MRLRQVQRAHHILRGIAGRCVPSGVAFPQRVKIVRLYSRDAAVALQAADHGRHLAPVGDAEAVEHRVDQRQAVNAEQREPLRLGEVDDGPRGQIGGEAHQDLVGNELSRAGGRHAARRGAAAGAAMAGGPPGPDGGMLTVAIGPAGPPGNPTMIGRCGRRGWRGSPSPGDGRRARREPRRRAATPFWRPSRRPTRLRPAGRRYAAPPKLLLPAWKPPPPRNHIAAAFPLLAHRAAPIDAARIAPATRRAEPPIAPGHGTVPTEEFREQVRRRFAGGPASRDPQLQGAVGRGSAPADRRRTGPARIGRAIPPRGSKSVLADRAVMTYLRASRRWNSSMTSADLIAASTAPASTAGKSTRSSPAASTAPMTASSSSNTASPRSWFSTMAGSSRRPTTPPQGFGLRAVKDDAVGYAHASDVSRGRDRARRRRGARREGRLFGTCRAGARAHQSPALHRRQSARRAVRSRPRSSCSRRSTPMRAPRTRACGR